MLTTLSSWLDNIINLTLIPHIMLNIIFLGVCYSIEAILLNKVWINNSAEVLNV